MSDTTPTPTYDKEDIYDAEIAPLMTQIIEICKRHEIPMLASFTYRSCPDGQDYCTTHLTGPNGWFDPKLARANGIMYADGSSPLMLTLRDGDGDVIESIAVVG